LFQRNNDPVELGKSRVTCSKETTTRWSWASPE
jgi:hypothetical protein